MDGSPRASRTRSKNPLTPIQLAAQAMHARAPGDERYLALVRESAAIIEEEVLGMRNP